MEIRVVERIGDGLAVLEVENYGRQVWVRSSRIGKGKACVFGDPECGHNLSGETSYRPSTNPANRGDRVCVKHVEEEVTLPGSEDHTRGERALLG